MDVVADVNAEVVTLLDIVTRSEAFMTLVSLKLPTIFSGPKLTDDELIEMGNSIIYFEEMSTHYTGGLQFLITEFAVAARAFVQTMAEMNVYTELETHRSLMNTFALAGFRPRMQRGLDQLRRVSTDLSDTVLNYAREAETRALVAANEVYDAGQDAVFPTALPGNEDRDSTIG